MGGTPHIPIEVVWSDVQTRVGTPHKTSVQENPYGRWAGGRFFQEILPLRGSILQAGTCQILSLAENPRWSRVWQLSK